jgi:integrase
LILIANGILMTYTGAAVPFTASEMRAPDHCCKQFREARGKAGIPESLVLYCARHTFGTATYGATGNLAMVMNVMGHTDVRTAMRYQHPVLDSVREAIDQRNLRHKPRHNELRVQ